MDWLLLFIGFFSGVLVYRVLSSFMELGQTGLYVREAEKNALVMLATVAESVAYMQSIKYRVMEEMEVPDHTIKLTKNVDDYNFTAWKNAAVSNLLAAYPEKYRKMARYVDWKTGMNMLNQIYKKGQK
mgnify:FL=1|tara:strand:- start:17 stop:400 length:384 start_codon:yes stop_codon:yes gene_type:complete